MKWFQLPFEVGDCQIPVSETGGEGRGLLAPRLCVIHIFKSPQKLRPSSAIRPESRKGYGSIAHLASPH